MAVSALPGVKRLVESGRFEKRVQARRSACLPRVQVLVENGCFPEGVMQVADLANAPKSDWLIKKGR